MKKKSIGLVFLLALSMISMIPVLSMTHVAAEPVTNPPADPSIIKWVTDTGTADAASLLWNPEYLRLHTISEVPSNTTVIVQGKDTYGQNIEATVKLNGTCALPVSPEADYIFNDTHSGQPVAFAQITGIFQQNGTHNVELRIDTQPEPFQAYLGEWHLSTGWLPGQYKYGSTSYPGLYGPVGTKYLVGTGAAQNPVKIQDVPVEPSNPDPIKIVLNWHENDGNLLPGAGEMTASTAVAWIWLEGLDENGNKLEANVTIPKSVTMVSVDAGYHTWSSICKVKGNGSDSYYIFTHPNDTKPLFYYRIVIDHITIQPDCYDILANPNAPNNAGVTNITVALTDRDGNLVHSASDTLVVNFATSGGKIQPSSDVYITKCHVTAKANLTADTNARTIKVTADANVPACHSTFDYPEMNLFAWTELTFDGINSVGTQWTTIHAMQWGWNSWNGTAWFSTFTGNVPPKPVLPPELGGPAATGVKLDGPIYEVMIPLYVGCNLISCPVHPMLCTNYYCEAYPTMSNHAGIPMSLLFGNTSATTCIEVIWWYNATAGTWSSFVPGVSTDGYFIDGVGYWIYAEKPCTLEISGVIMDNAPFTPPLYALKDYSWNLVGFTSLTPMSIYNYLESLNYGTVWTYYAYDGNWYRNPSWGLYPGYGFWVYSSGDLAP